MNDEVQPAPVLEGVLLTPEQRRRKGLFVKGDPRLKAGVRKYSKNKLSGDFIKDLAKWYKKDGYKAIEKVGREKPDKLLEIIAGFIPKQEQISVDQRIGISVQSIDLQEVERRTNELLARITMGDDSAPRSD